MPKKMQNSLMKTAEIHLIFDNGFKTMEFGYDFWEKSLDRWGFQESNTNYKQMHSFCYSILVELMSTSGASNMVSEPIIRTNLAQIMADMTVQMDHLYPDFEICHANKALFTH